MALWNIENNSWASTISLNSQEFENLIITLILQIRKQKSREDSGLRVTESGADLGFPPIQELSNRHHAKSISSSFKLSLSTYLCLVDKTMWKVQKNYSDSFCIW